MRNRKKPRGAREEEGPEKGALFAIRAIPRAGLSTLVGGERPEEEGETLRILVVVSPALDWD